MKCPAVWVPLLAIPLLAGAAPSDTPDDDPSAPALILETEVSPALDKARVTKGLDLLAEGAKKRVQEAEGPAERLDALLRYLTQERAYAAVEPAADLQACDFSRLLAAGHGSPENLALLYAALANRLGLALTPVYAPDRLLLRYDDGTLKTTVDLKEKTIGLTDAAYRKKLHLPEEDHYLEPLVPAGVEAVLRRRRSEVRLAAGLRTEALDDAGKAVTLDPARSEHHLALARARWALGDASGARSELALARERNPDSTGAALLDGDLLAADGDAEGASAAYARALTSESPAVQRQALLDRAALRSGLGQNDAAKADYLKALGLGGPSAEACLGREASSQLRDLAALAGRRAVPPVTADLKSQVMDLLAQARESDARHREHAQKRLEEMGPRAVPYIQEALRGNEPAPRLGALLILTTSPSAGCLEEVLGCAEAADGRVRLAAMGALASMAESESLRARILDRLRAVLEKDTDGEVRRRAATVLARYGDAAALPYFRRALQDKDAENRRQAALALGRMSDRESLPLLRETLSDEHPRVRARAAQALGLINDPAAVPELIRAVKDEDKDVRQEAVSALVRITRQDFGADASKWTDWWQAQSPPPP